MGTVPYTNVPYLIKKKLLFHTPLSTMFEPKYDPTKLSFSWAQVENKCTSHFIAS